MDACRYLDNGRGRPDGKIYCRLFVLTSLDDIDGIASWMERAMGRSLKGPN